ncbi:MAG: hypothetical protein WBA83_00300, partial [Burkholderiaceae bacterium]
MKRILLSSCLLALLAACSTVSLTPESETGAESPAGASAGIAEQPLKVPALESMRDTPPRPLAGKYKQASWASMQGWSSDDLDHVWKAFVNNCKGLMRPVSGSLAQQARATPRA